MREREDSVVDLLEIFYARQLRDQIIAQLKRLADPAPQGFVGDDARAAETARYYEAALITIAELLNELGDRRPLD